MSTTKNSRSTKSIVKPAAKPTTQSTESLEQLHIALKNAAVELHDIQQVKNKLTHEKQLLTDICTNHNTANTTLSNECYIVSNQIDTELQQQKDILDTYMNQVVHMKYEHKNQHSDLHTQIDTQLQSAHNTHVLTQQQFDTLKHELLQQIQQDTVQYNTEIKQLKELEAKELIKLTENFHSNYIQQQQLYAKQLAEMEQNLQLYSRIKLHEVNERKNLHINNLLQQHNTAIDTMKQYYHNITSDNLQLIKQLNIQLNTIKQQYTDNTALIEQITADNNKNSIPLQSSVQIVNQLQQKLSNYEKNQMNLKLNKNRLNQLTQQYKQNEQKYNDLLQQYQYSEQERNQLLSQFTNSIQSIQQNNNERNIELENKIQQLENEFHGKKLQFQQILKVSNLDNTVLNNVTNKLDVLLNEKNEQLKHLQYEITKTEKNNNSLIQYYDNKLKEHGIENHTDELAKTQRAMQQLAV